MQTSEWNVEDSRQWKTEDTDKFFYNIEEKEDGLTEDNSWGIIKKND